MASFKSIDSGQTVNALGLYDMSGNVVELFFDLSGLSRVQRGGSWFNTADVLQVGGVFSFNPYSEINVLGVRFGRSQ